MSKQAKYLALEDILLSNCDELPEPQTVLLRALLRFLKSVTHLHLTRLLTGFGTGKDCELHSVASSFWVSTPDHNISLNSFVAGSLR